MAQHNNTGFFGEELAVGYFIRTGFEIIAKNWRYSYYEVDIIASKASVLHFIEVKTRTGKSYGLPEEKVSNKKIRNLIGAAEQYLYKHPQWKRIQFNVLSITILPNEPVEYFFIEDVYL
ncbi:YraN family protein [Ferruginibacter albus]|uniref:YraN family protein n=1 Tax=Ferruginibacter albus TaxID=2875540 RepID=UPI001CC6EEDE|nr:YraN family protein [Ferruginibacter albus]UAY53029.1 YraN family protein [Ferruginibacter albus]